MQSEHVKRKRNPRESANIFSLLTFFYVTPLFKKSKEGLEEKDIYDVPSFLNASPIEHVLERNWEQQKLKRPSIRLTLIRTFGTTFILLGCIQLTSRLMMVWFQPWFLAKLIAFFASDQSEDKLKDAYRTGLGLISVNLFNCLCTHNYMQKLVEFILKVKSGVSSLIFSKVTKISQQSTSQFTVGNVITLITKDVALLDSALPLMNDFWTGFLQTILIVYLLYQRVGMAAFAGVGALILIIPIQMRLGKKVASLRKQSAKKTDERLKLTQETFSAIKLIKMYTWENFFETKINNSRELEIKDLTKIYYMKTIIIVIGMLSLKISFYVLILTYILKGNLMSAEVVYFIYMVFGQLRNYATAVIPLAISQTSDLLASLNRIEKFLLSEEINKKHYNFSEAPRVYLKNIAVGNPMQKDKNILQDVSLEVKQKGLVLINGPTGSGKSTILKTILREFEIKEGMKAITGTVSYAPQNPWVFPATIKQNILFYENYNEERYRKVLYICGLISDLNQFPQRDETVIADAGANFSKGQLARISLARTVYKKSDIYLLDDCLAALDGNVSNWVFKKCIQEFLNDKIVLMVTHNAYHIKLAKKILVVEDGKTKSLEEQAKVQLKDRITYYIDDEDDATGDRKEPQKVVEDSDSEEAETDEVDKLLPIDNLFKERSIYLEELKMGKVSFKTYGKYLKYCGGFWLVFGMVVFFVGAQLVETVCEKLLSTWVSKEQVLSTISYSATQNVTNNTSLNETLSNGTHLEQFNTTSYELAKSERDGAFKLYTIMLATTTVLFMIRSFAFFILTSKASNSMHKVMTTSLIHTKVNFFDKHYLGNILNRFSRDLSTIDEYIPILLYQNFILFLFIISTLGLIVTINKLFLIPATLVCVAFYFIRKMYITVGRSLKRLEASTRSPMIGHLNSSFEGLLVIRAVNKEERVRKEFDQHQNHFISTNYMAYSATRAFEFYLDLVCNLYSTSIIWYFLKYHKGVEASTVGLALTMAMAMVGLLQWAIRHFAELETNMTSVERSLEYTKPKRELGVDLPEPKNWPREGAIKFDQVKMTIAEESVLRNVNLEIEAKKTVSIVGRTGAGKSSLFASLFRLYDYEGDILIDGTNTKKINLTYLRKSIAIVPQDPVLFSGTIRSNVDPLQKYEDHEIWEALEKVRMKSKIASLDLEVTESGQEFSAGEKQLICLARALVSRNKIVVLDEITANVDTETEALIDQIIQEVFKGCTILVITHRLRPAEKSDQVIVMNNGQVMEFGTPEDLFESRGAFSILFETDTNPKKSL